jgi:hypothetical protein
MRVCREVRRVCRELEETIVAILLVVLVLFAAWHVVATAARGHGLWP